MRRPSTTGLVFCLLYAGLIAYCQWMVHQPGMNPKSLALFRELPVLLLMLAIGWLDLTLPDWLPWIVVSVATMALTFAIFYWLGSWLEKDYRRGQAYRRSISAKRGDEREQ